MEMGEMDHSHKVGTLRIICCRRRQLSDKSSTTQSSESASSSWGSSITSLLLTQLRLPAIETGTTLMPPIVEIGR